MCSQAILWWRSAPRPALVMGLLACAVLGTACDDDTESFVSPPAADDPRPSVVVCTPEATEAVTVKVNDSVAALGMFAAQAAHLVQLEVDPRRASSNGYAFRRITDAVAEARRIRREFTGRCPITINVLAGVYEGTTASTDTMKEALPIVFDMEGVSLIGSTRFARDTSGRLSLDGVEHPSADTNQTILVASPALRIVGGTTQTGIPEPLILVNREEGTSKQGGRITIAGFILRSGHSAGDSVLGGKGVLALRAPNVAVQRNRFEGNFTERVDLRGGSGWVNGNAFVGPGETCDICLAGPGTFTVFSNRLVQGGLPGVLIVPAIQLPVPAGVAQSPLPDSATVEVEVLSNDISGHQRVPVGVGVRIATVGINAPDVTGRSVVTLRDNLLHGNRFGVMVEAGFPVAGSRLRGDAEVILRNNHFAANCQADLYAAFTRHTSGLGLANLPYLKNSTIQIDLGSDMPWSSVWYAHPDGHGNHLQVGDQIVANGTHHLYNPTRVCS